MPSTAFSAEEVSRIENTACIVNKACSFIYDLDIIGDKIQDSKYNQTRSIILSKKEREFGNKTSIIFSTQNQPGELYRILGLFNIFK